MKLVNLTPHPVVLLGLGGGTVTIPPSGTVARCAVRREPLGRVDLEGLAVPIRELEYWAVEGLPRPAPSTLYLVSSVVAQAVQRDDVVIVDEVVRDEQGRVIGARALARLQCG